MMVPARLAPCRAAFLGRAELDAHRPPECVPVTLIERRVRARYVFLAFLAHAFWAAHAADFEEPSLDTVSSPA